LYDRSHVFRFPLDFSFIISRVLRRVRPSIIVLVELEVWFNLIRLATARGIPVAVVNGRLTARSERRFAKLGRLGRSMFDKLAWVGAQDEAIASRFRRLGVPAEWVEITSSLKWDSATVADRVGGADDLAQALGVDRSRQIWVCGSTGPREEAMILDAYRKLLSKAPGLARGVLGEPVKGRGLEDPILVIVPRKPERFDEVARLIEQAGFFCVRRSGRPDGVPAASWPDRAVVLGDTMGELRKFYSLADVVFVGRSLVPMGGSDPIEVAALGKPIVVGPHTDNFQAPVEALREAGAICIVDSADKVHSVVGAILADASLATELGSRARDVVIRHQGATERTVNGIVQLLETAEFKSDSSSVFHEFHD
jgi:3-deoxy-D-manno-octulosonic-acid transferase